MTETADFYTLHAMKNFRTIWTHEVGQADQITKIMLNDQQVALNWKIILLPIYLYHLFKYSKNLRFTRKNMLYTRQLAFEAAKNIFEGKDPAWEFRRIEIKTKEVLNKEKKGFYTEKIRRRQLAEIELLSAHYQALFSSPKTGYADIIKDTYQSKGNYLAFLSSLRKAEEDVIQAAVSTMRKGTKKDRRQWFQKVRETTKKVRMVDAEEIFTSR